MAISESDISSELSDLELIARLRDLPDRAWSLFCDRYADLIYTVLRRSGFDHDDAMECFVYICEKLREQDHRRLRSIKYAGEKGEITPWLRQVVKRMSISWIWAADGRKRLLSFVADMPERDRRVFELYFWHGQTPSQIHESLRLEHFADTEAANIFQALENIFGKLSQKKLWRLLSNLNRGRTEVSLDQPDEETGSLIEPREPGDGPETVLLRKEAAAGLARALGGLSTREKLVVQFRYEEQMTLNEIARMLGWHERETVNLHKSALYKLRKALI